MASKVLTDAFVSINSVDLSDQVQSVSITDTAELQDASAMGDKARRRKAGLRDWSMEITFYANYDASKVDATLDALIGVETALKVRERKADAIGATNPEYQGNGMLDSFPRIAGAVGEMHQLSVTFQGSDGIALIRATA
ncbi:MAG: radical SAM protein [Proteobacteria bacterium]|nr:radical SAM protein [Pseudomonadota bacterium]